MAVVVIVAVYIGSKYNLEFSTLAHCKIQPKMIQSAGGVQVLLQMGGEVLEIG